MKVKDGDLVLIRDNSNHKLGIALYDAEEGETVVLRVDRNTSVSFNVAQLKVLAHNCQEQLSPNSALRANHWEIVFSLVIKCAKIDQLEEQVATLQKLVKTIEPIAARAENHMNDLKAHPPQR